MRSRSKVSSRARKSATTSPPKIFLSYSSADTVLAKRICLELQSQKYEVFFGAETLPAGRPYNNQIRKALERCDLFVFLVSPDSVRKGSYTLTELRMAEDKWPSPEGRILPAFASATSKKDLEPYLSAVSIYEAKGDLVAEIAEQVRKLVKKIAPGWGDNDVLRQQAEQFAHRIRDFLRNAEWKERNAEPSHVPLSSLDPPAAFQQVVRESSQRQALAQLKAEHMRQSEELFAAEAIRLLDELLSRVRPDRSGAPPYDKPVYPGGGYS